MHIDFKKVILHNFISFGHTELKFEDDGFIKVTGVNENPDDLAVSNGSGKSSLWESIIWALTGETIRGTKHVSNIYGEDGTYVELEFMIDTKHYIIIRSKDHREYKTGIRIIIDGVDCSGKGVRDSEKLLAQYLPDITPSFLGSVIILGQGLPQKFTNNTPSGRKEVLEKLSKSDFMIEDLKKRVSARKEELNTTIRSIQDKIVSLTSTKSHLSSQIESTKNSLELLDGTTLQSQLITAQSNLVKCQEQISSLEKESVIKLEELENLNQSLVSITDKQTELQESIKERYSKDILFYQSEVARLTSDINSFKRELSRIQNIKDICPTCGQKLPDVHKPDTSSVVTSIETLTPECETAKNKLFELTQSQENELQISKQKFNVEKTTLTSNIRNLNEYISKIQSDKNLYTESERTLQVMVATIQSQLAQLETTIQHYQKIISDNQVQIQEIDDQLMYNNSELDLQQSHLAIINKFDTALKRDFRGYLLSTVIDYISIRAKEYSKIIFETDKIEFCLDGNNIDISYMNKSYENLSGGEKQKVDLIIQFSIRDMLCSHLGFTSNIIVLDEVFDALDMIGCQKVLDVISSLTDIKNIFIVTHRKDLSIPCDKELIVVKSPSGISEIK